MKFVQLSIIALFLLVACVQAHMGLEPPTAVAGARTIVTLRIGHDCGDETVGTTNFTVVLPKYMSSVSVEQMPHWRVFIHKVNGTVGDMKKYYHDIVPHKHDHEMIMSPGPDDIDDKDDMEPEATPSPEDMELVEYVSAITYIGFLPDYFYQLFNIRIRMPNLPGAELWFKGYQDCHNQGTSLAWEMMPTEENPRPRYPARALTLVEEEITH